MAKRIRIVLNEPAIGSFLKGEEVAAEVRSIASERFSSLPAGYAMRDINTGQRIGVKVYAETEEAKRDNSENNTLLKVFGV